MSLDLNDRVILVSGAARGLGFAYSKCLVEHGATVAMHDGGVDQYGLNPDSKLIFNAAMQVGSDRVLPVSGLLNTQKECVSLIEEVVNQLGRLDGLISNAGVVIWKHTTEVDHETFDSSSAVNHEASFWLCQAALPIMQKQEFGRIVLTSSGWALGPCPGSEKLTLYCQSKGAQLGFGMALANGTGHPNIKVNVIAPVANTRIYASEVEAGKLRPESVAGTATWLVSPDCDVNGRIIKVADGTISMIEMTETGSSFLGELSKEPDACGKVIQKMANTRVH